MPLSIIITKKKYLNKIKDKFGSILLPSSTYQGHSLGVAAALGAQKIVNNSKFLSDVCKKGIYLRNTIKNELSSLDFFNNVRGRGMRNSLEYTSPNNEIFSEKIRNNALNRHKLIINARWHRVCFSPAINVQYSDLDMMIEKIY